MYFIKCECNNQKKYCKNSGGKLNNNSAFDDLNIISIVFGCLGILGSITILFCLFGFIFSLIGLVFAILSTNIEKKTISITLNSIGLSLSGFVFYIFIWLFIYL